MYRGLFDAVICDIDGCLSPEASTPFDTLSLAQIAEHNRKAIEDSRGPIVTVCSGRPQPFAEAMCRAIGNDRLPCVAENGVWLYHPDKNIYDRDPDISPEDLAAVHEASLWVERDLAPKGVVMQPGKVASISLYHHDTDLLRSLEPFVRETFERESWPMRISMTWLYMNCDLRHISKATGVGRLMAAADLKHDRLAGIGDTMSDAAIRERVAWFACPANADDRLKERADYVSDHHEALGILDILATINRMGR